MELARRFLAALSECDQAAVGELVHPEVEIRTERTVHRGRGGGDDGREGRSTTWSAATSRSRSRRPSSGVLVHAELQYVWRESGEVGDSSRVAIELGIRDGLISSWYLRRRAGLAHGPMLGLKTGPSLYANRSKR